MPSSMAITWAEVMPSTTTSRRDTVRPLISSRITCSMLIAAGKWYSPTFILRSAPVSRTAMVNTKGRPMTPSAASWRAIASTPAPRGITRSMPAPSGPRPGKLRQTPTQRHHQRRGDGEKQNQKAAEPVPAAPASPAHGAAVKITEALVPPKPKEFDSAVRTGRRFASRGNQVDAVAFRRRVVEVEGRRHHAIVDGEDRVDRLDASRRAEHMADRRLGRRHRYAVGGSAEQPLDRGQLNVVAERGRGGVGVDVVDVLGIELGARQRRGHGAVPAGAVRRRRGDVVGVAGQAVADELGVNPGAAIARMLQLLEHHDSGALPHHESVAVAVPRPRRPRRRIVEVGGQRARGREPGDAEAADRRLRPARHHHLGVLPHDQPGGVTDRMRASRAGGNRGMVGPLEAVLDRNVAGRPG